MNAFERAEVSHYPEVWYLGMDAAKIEGDEHAGQNCGYDDDNGSYVKASDGQMSTRYESARRVLRFSFSLRDTSRPHVLPSLPNNS